MSLNSRFPLIRRSAKTIRNALLQLVPDSLNPTAKGAQRDAQLVGHRLSIVDFHPRFVFIVFQDQLQTFSWQFPQAQRKTAPLSVIVLHGRWCHWNGFQFVKTHLPVLGLLECFEKDESSDALTVGGDITNLLPVFQLSDYSIERFVCTFFRKASSTPVKNLHQLLANRFILSARAVRVGIEA